ncbi:MAG TPA: GPW/gp25 family protein [Thermoanaerobaculia bacterium]|nr:GPW/gp25 family protein [Thermoanaerobaculia bacterium]
MAPRTIPEPILGRDLRLDYAWGGGFFEDADLAENRPPFSKSAGRDIGLASGLDNLTQAIANRLKTRRGELASLGHPDYGSRHHELLGEPNVERTRNLIKLYVLQALRHEPRIEKVLKADVRAEHSPPRDSVRIELSVRVTGEPVPLNLVVPFSLEVGL